MDRITDRLYIGSFTDAEDRVNLREHGVRTVVTLCPRESVNTDIHRPLTDGKNPQEQFDEAVDAALERIRQGNRVLVHCAAGVSRSAAVCATLLAVREHRSFADALETVKKQRPRIDPHPGLKDNAKRYIERHD